MRRLPARILAGMLVLSAGLSACTAEDPSEGSDASPASAAEAEIDVSALPVRQVAAPAPLRLADDLVPPTNRWYSGLVFGEAPSAVYPFPLAFSATASTFEIDVPPVSVTPTTIAASAGAGLVVTTEATRFEVVRHDPVSVTLRYSDDDGPVGDVTIAEGWPVVAFTALRDTTLATPAPLEEAAEGAWRTSAEGTEYTVLAPGASSAGASLTLPEGESAQWFTVPRGATLEAWIDALGAPVTAAEASFAAADGEIETRLTYVGADSTALVPFPANGGAEECTLGTFTTAYGPATACAATELAWSTPRLDPVSSFDLSPADDATRQRIAAALEADLRATPELAADTYGGGKALARLGSLALLATSLGRDDLAEEAADRLWEELSPWMEPGACSTRDARCFVYDDHLRTVVGLVPTFGSEEANDHHFHYGYFLSAGAALAQIRPELVEQMQPVMTLLAADIAGGTAGDLAALRVFDPYRGHSWASGYSPFADGNNQESTSEAVSAWNALALWSRAAGDEALAARAEWMLSAEAAAARALWLEPDLSGIPGAETFAHEMFSLTWGGKRDYATWFSAEPSAILGIQLIPVAPIGLAYLGEDPERVRRNVAEAGGADAFERPLGDYVLAYSALGGEDAARTAAEALESLPDEAIDPGNARSLMLAWLAAAGA